MAGGHLAGRRRRHPDRANPCGDRRVDLRERPLGIVQRHDADPDQAFVAAAELGHRPVQRPRAAILHVGVLRRHELRGGEGGEHQLPGEAEVVERLAALARVDRAVGRPALGSGHHVGGDLGGRDRVLLAGQRLGDRLLGARAAGLQPHALQPAADRRVRIALEPVEALHDVAVGVIDDASRSIGHPLRLLFVVTETVRRVRTRSRTCVPPMLFVFFVVPRFALLSGHDHPPHRRHRTWPAHRACAGGDEGGGVGPAPRRLC